MKTPLTLFEISFFDGFDIGGGGPKEHISGTFMSSNDLVTH